MMLRLFVFAVAAFTAFLPSVPAAHADPAEPDDPAAETAFLNILTEAGVQLTVINRRPLIEDGKGICRKLRAGESQAAITSSLLTMGDPNMSPWLAAILLAAAPAALPNCAGHG